MLSREIIKAISKITSRAFPMPPDPAKLQFIGVVVDAVKDRRLCLEDFEIAGLMAPVAAVRFLRGRLVAARSGRGGEVVPPVSG